jgi:hypothetical protein
VAGGAVHPYCTHATCGRAQAGRGSPWHWRRPRPFFKPSIPVRVSAMRPLRCCYGGQSRGCIWYSHLRYPHLILPYLAYYGHLASQHGGPWCSPIPW